ncbi:MAG TPA: MFS transporter [Candidatus Sulfopaludibacter sp.]|jgi:MFS family permease|nr:MFS transporter [Candidatus Sulfopaludibacter sp.]
MKSIFRDKSIATLVILSLIGLTVMYIETMVSPAIPDFISDFKISYNVAPWILTAYLVVAVVMTPIMGRLSDLYGRKRVLLIGLIIYAIGTFAAGFATNIYFMLIARAVEGVGIGIFPVAVAIVRNQSSEEKLAFNQGIITSMFATGAVIGLAAGGMIIHYFGWRSTFFTIMPLVILLIILVIRFIHDSNSENIRNNGNYDDSGEISTTNSKIDIKGALVFSIGIISILLIITNLEGKMSFANWFVIGSLSIIGCISLISFAFIENKIKSPLIDLKLIANKVLLSANILRMIAGLFMFMILNTMPILIRNPKPIGFGESSINTASIIVPFMIAYLLIGVSSGFILSRLGNIRVIIIGSLICIVGFTNLLFFFHNLVTLLSGLAILGIGSQLLHQGAININLVSTPKNQTGISFGISNVFYLMGSAIGPTIVGMYMQANQTSINGIVGSFPSSYSYILIFETGVILSLMTIIVDIIVLNRVKEGRTTIL